MQNASENIILKKTIEFSLAIIEYAEVLEQQKKFVIARQLLRCGTSIGANVHEAQNAKAKVTLFISLKSLPKRLKKQGTGWSFATIQRTIRPANI